LDAHSLVSILYSKFQNSHDEEDIENLRKADMASTPHLASPHSILILKAPFALGG
jgi:hypothetical protein